MISKLFILLIIIIILLLIIPLFIFNKNNNKIKLSCNVNSNNNVIKGNGFLIIKNILHDECRNKIINKYLKMMRKNKKLNEDKNLEFYTDKFFLSSLSKLLGEKLYPVNPLDLQRCWLRYYFEGMKAQYYENYHHDIKRYDNSIKQYRLVIPIYDTSDSFFTIKDYGTFKFTENMGVFLEADNCLHKVEFKKGERLLLIMDFINKECDTLVSHYSCRNIRGYTNWVKDTIWRYISSFYYNIANINLQKKIF